MLVNRDLSDYLYWKVKKLRGQGDIRRRLLFLLKNQHKPPEEIKELQFNKLRKIIEHSYNTVPYYKEVMLERGLTPSDFSSFSDIKQLPLMTRDVLRIHQEKLVSSKADFKTLKTNFSSGSTGIRAQFKQDLNFRIWMRAHQLRTYGWCADWKLGEKFMLLWGSEIYWSKKQFIDQFENLLTNRREFNTFKLSNKLINRFLDKIYQFQPKLISTYSNAIHLISLEAQKRNIEFPSVKAIQCTSEPLPTVMRDRIKTVFNCEIFDKYGSRETNVVAHESPNHEQMCIQSENVFVEFLNPKGKECEDGEKGKLVITTLNNFSMPLIRYETSDIAAPVEGYCSSGIGLPRMTSVGGRIQDLILTPNGDHIDAYFFSYLIMRFPTIHWFQVVQYTIDELNIRLFAPGGLSKEDVNNIKDRVRIHTGFDFIIHFEHLKEMPISSTGKFRLCISKLTENYLSS